jgi:hypothetical protein
MLKIKRIRSYTIPRYPVGQFETWKQPAGVALLKRGVSSAALLLLLDSCIGAGLHGVPRWVEVTEADARATIDSVFASNGIRLTPDFPFDVALSAKDTAHVTLDGYNDSLRVGYEYVSEADSKSVNNNVWEQITSNAAVSGPHVRIAWGAEERTVLAHVMQRYIDVLKAHGTI